MITEYQQELMKKCYTQDHNFYVAKINSADSIQFEQLVSLGFAIKDYFVLGVDTQNVYRLTEKGQLKLVELCRASPDVEKEIALRARLKLMTKNGTKEYIQKRLKEISDILKELNMINYKWTEENCPLASGDHCQDAQLLFGVGCSEWQCGFCGKEFCE